MSSDDFNKLNTISEGTVSASKAVVVDANKDISGFRNISATGNTTIGGTLSVNSITLTSGSITVDTDITASQTSVVSGSGITVTIDATSTPQGTIITLLSDGTNTYTLNNGNGGDATIANNVSTTIITTGTSAGDVVAYSNGTAVTFA